MINKFEKIIKEDFGKAKIFRIFDYLRKPEEETRKDAQRVLKEELRDWVVNELKREGISEKEADVYARLVKNIVENKNKLEKLSEYLSQYKIFGHGADALVGFAGGAAVRGAVRSFLKWTWFGIAGAGAGTAAGLISGGVFGFFREKFAAEKTEYNAEKWQEYLSGKSEEELESTALAVKNAIKECKVKGNKEEALQLVLRLRQVDAALINSRAERIGLMPGEVLVGMEESAENNPVLNEKAQNVLNHILEEKNKVVKEKAVKGALKGAAFGAIGGAIADWLFGTNDGREVVEQVKSQIELQHIPAEDISPPETEEAVEELKEVAEEGVKEKAGLADTVVMRKGDTVWDITKNYLEGYGIDNPTPKQILEASKVVVSDPDNNIGVKIWNIEGKIEDVKMPVGFELDMSNLKDFVYEKGWAVPEVSPEQLAESINVPSEEIISETEPSEVNNSVRNWILAGVALTTAGGATYLVKELVEKRGRKEKEEKEKVKKPKEEKPKEEKSEAEKPKDREEERTEEEKKKDEKEEVYVMKAYQKKPEEKKEKKEVRKFEPEIEESFQKTLKKIEEIWKEKKWRLILQEKKDFIKTIHGIYKVLNYLKINNAVDDAILRKNKEELEPLAKELLKVFKKQGYEGKKFIVWLILSLSILDEKIAENYRPPFKGYEIIEEAIGSSFLKDKEFNKFLDKVKGEIIEEMKKDKSS